MPDSPAAPHGTAAPGTPPGPARAPAPGGAPVLDRLNAAPRAELEALLRGVCTARAWVSAVAASRPWADGAALLAAGAAATAALTPDGLAEAVAGHARIGAPEEGGADSRREQAGVADADPALLAELRTAVAAYEERFGHAFLIRATGRTAAEMLAAARDRYANAPAAEWEHVRRELGGINVLRLERLLAGGAP
ncbi:2-oxo-4-hydroxy-4-carboxy-5-ureidoimidazoline decarboxylase [Streptomyces sp. NPDC001380]|uniref:2-oxo-4-hydroxy-4-carboxy-5-ureidoimidazoline decarboxylase n=1 Tax=Streptomyces sp. NPDC001380 TaxID=3364566 RepID=UPI0036C50407